MAFLVWMVFFDQNKLTNQIELSQQINELERNQLYYEEQIDVVKEARADLNSNLEKYAYGLNPAQTYPPGSLFTMRIDSARQSLTLRYEKSKTAIDALITPIWTSSLTDPNWRNDLFTTTLVGETETHEIWEAAIPLSTTPQRFVRLRFTAL